MFSTTILLVTTLMASTAAVAAYAPMPELNRQALAGVWRLTNQRQHHGRPKFPMKEFTVYPKKPKVKLDGTAAVQDRLVENPPFLSQKDLLIKLKEDGSFVASIFDLLDEDDEDDEEDEGEKLLYYRPGDEKKDSDEDGVMRGTWDYLDGKLILATDRPEDTSSSSLTGDRAKVVQDTVLMGRVVAEKGRSLVSNPILGTTKGGDEGVVDSDKQTGKDGRPLGEENESSSTPSSPASFSPGGSDSRGTSEHRTSASSSSSSTGDYDIHLSVPDGSVKVGKYFYPKKHPSFFDNPIYSPKKTGKFELRQVLGMLNAQNRQEEENELVERFRKNDLADKRYFVTSHPIGYRKKRERFNRSLNRYVEVRDPIDPKEKVFGIRAMEVALFANNTFSTVAGLGNTILRGKWSIIGEKRDHLWMQIWRFGFGRSVSGSTYSEGTFLTMDDEKTYWGKINWLEQEDVEDESATDDDISSADSTGDGEVQENAGLSEKENSKRIIEVQGSVMMGWGLEPCPVARFTMTEKTIDDEEDDEDDDEDDVDVDDDEIEEDTHDDNDGPFFPEGAFE